MNGHWAFLAEGWVLWLLALAAGFAVMGALKPAGKADAGA